MNTQGYYLGGWFAGGVLAAVFYAAPDVDPVFVSASMSGAGFIGFIVSTFWNALTTKEADNV